MNIAILMKSSRTGSSKLSACRHCGLDMQGLEAHLEDTICVHLAVVLESTTCVSSWTHELTIITLV